MPKPYNRGGHTTVANVKNLFRLEKITGKFQKKVEMLLSGKYTIVTTLTVATDLQRFLSKYRDVADLLCAGRLSGARLRQ